VEQKALAALEISHWAYVLALGRVIISAPAAQLLARPDLGDVFLGQITTQELGPPQGTGATPAGPPPEASQAPTRGAMT
jgi:branched-chain amino acid transport system ATP-binding protein